jgi:pimeloyl-ACP methyl ester carboxylesterase
VTTELRCVSLPTGIATAYLEQGDPGAPLVMLLHAWVESRESFCRFLPALPDDLYVVAPDLRGHGDADKPAAGYALDDLTGDVIGLLDVLQARRVVLVGASSGGYVAQQVAVEQPDRVAGLVLAGAPRSLRRRAPFADDVDRLTDPIDPAWVRSLTASMTTSPEVPGWYRDLMVDQALRVPAEIWRASLHGLSRSWPPTEVGDIHAPTLVVAGDTDMLPPGDDSRSLAAAIRGSRWREYHDTGHLVLWERPGQLAADVATFVEELRESGDLAG